MTKLIAILIILAVLFGGWQLFFYWERIKNEEETQKKQAAAAVVVGDQLPGMPNQLEPSLKAAESQGAAGLKNWLKAYGKSIQDPRKSLRSQARFRRSQKPYSGVFASLATDQTARKNIRVTDFKLAFF